MVLDVDVLRAVVEYRVFRESNASLIISVDHHWTSWRDTVYKTGHPYRFLRRLAERYVLRFR